MEYMNLMIYKTASVVLSFWKGLKEHNAVFRDEKHDAFAAAWLGR